MGYRNKRNQVIIYDKVEDEITVDELKPETDDTSFDDECEGKKLLEITVDTVLSNVRNKMIKDPSATTLDMFGRLIRSLIKRSDKRGIAISAEVSSNQDDYTRRNYTACTVINPHAALEADIYRSSRTIYDELQVRTELSKPTMDSKKNNKVTRVISYNKYFCTDSTFPLFKNLLYLESERTKIKSRSNDKQHHEINLYYEIPKIIYYFLDQPFESREFKEQYTPMEYYKLIDFLTSLILDLITEREEEILIELLRKDRVLRNFYDEIENSYKEFMLTNDMSYRVSVDMFDIHLEDIINRDATTPLQILKITLCIIMTRLTACLAHLVAINPKHIAPKAISDYRMIVGLAEGSNDYTISLLLPEKPGCNCDIRPRIFRGSGAFRYLEYVVEDERKRQV